ncbi:MAG: hypothetical protein VX236_00860 [Pseudomonadota bacterium]|nr:hypothetical protein [Pseudomonadota bacterium]
MSAFENAQKFFEACETALGWEACKDYVEEAAPLIAQSEPLIDIRTVEDYCNWMQGFGTVTAAGATYTLNAASYDEERRTALFFATYHGTHTGEGGPVPPTNKSTNSHYVYSLKMSDNDKVAEMTKIWNAPWAMRELGWIE